MSWTSDCSPSISPAIAARRARPACGRRRAAACLWRRTRLRAALWCSGALGCGEPHRRDAPGGKIDGRAAVPAERQDVAVLLHEVRATRALERVCGGPQTHRPRLPADVQHLDDRAVAVIRGLRADDEQILVRVEDGAVLRDERAGPIIIE